MPVTMISTSMSEHKDGEDSLEEDMNHVDGKVQEKIAKYGGY